MQAPRASSRRVAPCRSRVAWVWVVVPDFVFECEPPSRALGPLLGPGAGRLWRLASWPTRAAALGCRDLLLGAPPEPETRVAHGHRRGSSGASGASRHTHTSRHTHSVQTVERALVRRGRCRRTLGPRPPGRVQLQAAGVGTPLVWPDAVTLTVRHVTRMLWSASTSPQPLALHLSTVASTSPLPFSDELCVAVVQHWSVCNVLQCASSGVA